MRQILQKRFSLLNKLMQLNMGCLLLHLLLYGPVPDALLNMRNPFGDLLLALAIVAAVGLFFLIDFLLPIYLDARMRGWIEVTRPVGALLVLNSLSLVVYSATWL
jgi:hypothetical protein